MRLLRAGDRLERRRAAVPEPVDLLDARRCRRGATSRSRTAARRPPSARTRCGASRARAATASGRRGGSRAARRAARSASPTRRPRGARSRRSRLRCRRRRPRSRACRAAVSCRRGGAGDVAVALVEVLHREVHAVAARARRREDRAARASRCRARSRRSPRDRRAARRRRSGTRRPRRRAAATRRSTTCFSILKSGTPKRSRPPRRLVALEHGHRVAGAVQLLRAREPGRPRADDRDRLVGARARAARRRSSPRPTRARRSRARSA